MGSAGGNADRRDPLAVPFHMVGNPSGAEVAAATSISCPEVSSFQRILGYRCSIYVWFVP